MMRIPGSAPVWAMFDRGYIGVGTGLPQAILPFKEPPNGDLNARQQRFNEMVIQDRIIVERWSDRHKTLWGVMAAVFPLHGVAEYEMIYRFCAALTNFHEQMHPPVGISIFNTHRPP